MLEPISKHKALLTTHLDIKCQFRQNLINLRMDFRFYVKILIQIGVIAIWKVIHTTELLSIFVPKHDWHFKYPQNLKNIKSRRFLTVLLMDRYIYSVSALQAYLD